MATNETKSKAFSQTVDTTQTMVQNNSYNTKLKKIIVLGATLRQEISDNKFDAFLIVLFLSLLKDFPDLFTWVVDIFFFGFFSTTLNIAVSLSLLMVFFMQKSALKKWIFKKFIWKYLLVFIIELIPGFNVFPSYIISAIFLKRKINKKTEELKQQLKEVEELEKKEKKSKFKKAT